MTRLLPITGASLANAYSSLWRPSSKRAETVFYFTIAFIAFAVLAIALARADGSGSDPRQALPILHKGTLGLLTFAYGLAVCFVAARKARSSIALSWIAWAVSDAQASREFVLRVIGHASLHLAFAGMISAFLLIRGVITGDAAIAAQVCSLIGAIAGLGIALCVRTRRRAGQSSDHAVSLVSPRASQWPVIAIQAPRIAEHGLIAAASLTATIGACVAAVASKEIGFFYAAVGMAGTGFFLTLTSLKPAAGTYAGLLSHLTPLRRKDLTTLMALPCLLIAALWLPLAVTVALLQSRTFLLLLVGMPVLAVNAVLIWLLGDLLLTTGKRPEPTVILNALGLGLCLSFLPASILLAGVHSYTLVRSLKKAWERGPRDA